MHPIAVRIIGGENVCPSEIALDNATRIMDWVRDTDSHHTKETCPHTNHCVHAPGLSDIEWAASLTTEASYICKCGEHGVDDPEGAADAVGAWRERWSYDTDPCRVTGKRTKKETRHP